MEFNREELLIIAETLEQEAINHGYIKRLDHGRFPNEVYEMVSLAHKIRNEIQRMDLQAAVNTTRAK